MLKQQIDRRSNAGINIFKISFYLLGKLNFYVSWAEFLVCSGELFGVQRVQRRDKDAVCEKRADVSTNNRQLFSHLVCSAIHHLHERVLDSEKNYQKTEGTEPTQNWPPHQVVQLVFHPTISIDKS